MAKWIGLDKIKRSGVRFLVLVMCGTAVQTYFTLCLLRRNGYLVHSSKGGSIAAGCHSRRPRPGKVNGRLIILIIIGSDLKVNTFTFSKLKVQL